MEKVVFWNEGRELELENFSDKDFLTVCEVLEKHGAVFEENTADAFLSYDEEEWEFHDQVLDSGGADDNPTIYLENLAKLSNDAVAELFKFFCELGVTFEWGNSAP